MKQTWQMVTISVALLNQALVGYISKGTAPLSQILTALIPYHSCEFPKRLTYLACLIRKTIRHGVRLHRIAPIQHSRKALGMDVSGR